MKLQASCALILIGPSLVLASLSTAPAVGIRENPTTTEAFIHARVVVSPTRTLENANLVIKEGRIVAIGSHAKVPADARVQDFSGLTITPAFIDGYATLGLPFKDGSEKTVKGSHNWNPTVFASRSMADFYAPDLDANKKMRESGFGLAQSFFKEGIIRGQAAIVLLGDERANEAVIAQDTAQSVTLAQPRIRGTDDETFPVSKSGVIALLRQSLYDARWYRDAQRAQKEHPLEPGPEKDLDLEALWPVLTEQVPLVVDGANLYDIFRVAELQKEFKLRAFSVGSGQEYQRLDAIKKTRLPLYVPLDFPKAPSVTSVEDALEVSLADLRHWDEAPSNPQLLAGAKIPFALTTARLKDPSNFLPNLRKAIARGLSAQAALSALTTIPAQWLGLSRDVGTIEVGKRANFLVWQGEWSSDGLLRQTWVMGKRFDVSPIPDLTRNGAWQLTLLSPTPTTLDMELDADPKLKLQKQDSELKVSEVSVQGALIEFVASVPGLDTGLVRFSGLFDQGVWRGQAALSNGEVVQWVTHRQASSSTPTTSEVKQAEATPSFPMLYPLNEFGFEKAPEPPAALLIKNATIWTSGPKGTLKNGDLLIEHGRIAKVGPHLQAPQKALVIDGTGKHVTPGLIDTHSHSGITGLSNEYAPVVAAQVRMGDVIDPSDPLTYQHLAGGITESQLLHGSSDPIGAQSQLIKLRWGASADDMKFKKAPATIKFALGENPKRNFLPTTKRYPRTRLGVEQIIRDEFDAAVDYEAQMAAFKRGLTHIPVRRNLELDAIVAIRQGKLLVHAHSYRQDEIMMLLDVAHTYGFKVAVLQHVLEGYKIADTLAKAGVGASTFSDWWSYKYEVLDGIPYNAAMMHDAGVLVSINSDDDEMARRLNVEAAKSIKYGGLSEDEALKLMTINPAKQLRVDKWVGSLEAGKDADFVVWSGNPLSSLSSCEQTWIDGRKYFDRDDDQRMRIEAERQKNILIQKVLKGDK